MEYGWHLAAPMQHGAELIGILTVDNLLRKQPMKNYEPELLRMYGITVGHLMRPPRARSSICRASGTGAYGHAARIHCQSRA
ncbi:MAG: hypothetical protein IPK17_11490 [Chloroflexi bacterium]|uniref:hypothetical protein n=1 Tax=Candidatus Flexifilum breve TaxID=3140694 RepID=UPI003134BE30|nr:hypothetical protein [Chloroflexota bacterium]